MTSFLWALLAASCWGFAPLFEKAGLRGASDPVAGVLIRSVGVALGALAILPIAPHVGRAAATLPAKQWMYLLAGGIMASVLGQICFYQALKTGEISRVVPVGASYPVLACLLGIIFLHEPVSASKLAGIGLVVIGTYLLR
jgi:transporter family protein